MLRAELLSLRTKDQHVARDAFEASEADDRFRGKFAFEVEPYRSDWPEAFLRAEAVTATHAERLAAIVSSCGWPGRSLVGEDGADAAWLLLQHAGADLQRHCLPLLRQALAAGEVTAQQYAAVADRIALLEGGLQIFATHLALDAEGRHVPTHGVDDPALLDHRRAGTGLAPWSDYVVGLGGRPGRVVGLARRPATELDTAIARRVHHLAYRDVVVAQFGAWNEEVQDGFFADNWATAAFEMLIWDGEACGYACVEQRADDVHVRELVVTPDCQSRGIGTTVLRQAIETARNRSVPVVLGTFRANRAADLYRRLGFSEFGQTETHLLFRLEPTQPKDDDGSAR